MSLAPGGDPFLCRLAPPPGTRDTPLAPVCSLGTARDVLMVLGMAVARTPMAVLICSTIFYNIMVPPLGGGEDLDPWKVRDARDGVMPQPLLTQTQKAATETWHPMVQAGPAEVAPMDFNSSGLNGSTHDIDFTTSFARECDSLTCGCVSALRVTSDNFVRPDVHQSDMNATSERTSMTDPAATDSVVAPGTNLTHVDDAVQIGGRSPGGCTRPCARAAARKRNKRPGWSKWSKKHGARRSQKAFRGCQRPEMVKTRQV